MKNRKTLTLHCKEIAYNKTSFISTSTNINGEWFKVKFTRECVDAPKIKGMYTMVVDIDDMSISNGRTYTDKNGITKIDKILWIRNIVDIQRFTEGDLRKVNRLKMSEIFDDVEIED